jgi:hypothetical protein
MGKFYTGGNGATIGWCDESHYNMNQCWPVKTWIRFSNSYKTTPQVSVSISHLNSESTVRVDVSASSVDNHGFYITINRWASTKMYSVRVSWIACGN